MLDIAPPRARATQLPKMIEGSRYTAVNWGGGPPLKMPHRYMAMDPTHLSFSDKCFDLAIASNVLATIRSDFMAMWELHRCLRDDGMAILTEPLRPQKKTKRMDGERIPEGETRPIAWRYGEDYLERLEAAGFFVLRLPLDSLGPYTFHTPEIFLGFKFKGELEKFEEGLLCKTGK